MLRTTKKDELEVVMKIIEDGREFLKEQGVNQWQHGAPSRDTIINDINEGISYIYDKSGVIVGAVMLIIFDEDYENYSIFWVENNSYLSIHCISTEKTYKIKTSFVNFCKLFAFLLSRKT